MPPVTVIKLGGSAITDKSGVFRARWDVLDRVAAQLRELVEVDGERLVVVHGGGSFGHPVAVAYGVGLRPGAPGIGFSYVRRAMMLLHLAVVESMLEHGIPAAPMSPSSMMTTRGGEVDSASFEPVRRAVEAGLVPVLHGDVVLDSELGFYIVSGDKLALELARRLNVRLVVFGSDVSGVYTRDPKLDERARLIRVVRASQGLPQIACCSRDATGGIAAKLEHAIRIAEMGVPVVIGDITREGGLLRLVRGVEKECTWVLP